MPEYLESNVQGCLIDPLVEHSQGNDVQKPRYQFSDLLHSSVGRALLGNRCLDTKEAMVGFASWFSWLSIERETMSESQVDNLQVYLIVQLVEDCKLQFVRIPGR